MSKYVIVTAARNEEKVIRHALESVTSQSLLPERLVIVDDGSGDRTAEIVREFQGRHPWIHLVQRPARKDRSFAGKAHAVNAGLEHLEEMEYDYVCNLDADVSFEPDFAAFVVERLDGSERLGIAGTPFTEGENYDSTRDSFEGENYVAGPCQFFRRECWEEIGGYQAHAAGGVDWIAVMTARMIGWEVRAFPEKRFHHHRSMGTAERGEFAAQFAYGEKDYYLGGAPLWQLVRVTYRATKPPYLTGGVALGLGYLWAWVKRRKRAVSPELMKFHRREQYRKLRAILATLLRFKRVNGFRLQPESR